VNSCGVFGYPYDEAAQVALSTCRERCDALKEVHFVLFEQEAWDAWEKAATDMGLEKQ
jgi:O-acetyl-ADP-ribose deacetylase (regulator of RNase III)